MLKKWEREENDFYFFFFKNFWAPFIWYVNYVSSEVNIAFLQLLREENDILKISECQMILGEISKEVSNVISN